MLEIEIFSVVSLLSGVSSVRSAGHRGGASPASRQHNDDITHLKVGSGSCSGSAELEAQWVAALLLLVLFPHEGSLLRLSCVSPRLAPEPDEVLLPTTYHNTDGITNTPQSHSSSP